MGAPANRSFTKEMSELRIGPYIRTYRDVLGARLSTQQKAMLTPMLSFFTWRTLMRKSGLEEGAP
ncbi:hypothetical protein M2351_007076 [Azospirillum canadense]|nr:hypothetical protein [Azospirillum canadense]